MKKTRHNNSNTSCPPSLKEVWKWKEATHKDIKDMSHDEILKYFKETTKDVIKKLDLKKSK
ncbi:MAG TPA: hypothetical protein PK443_00925 [bacterium]|nr:hypothetical protein [bacterium]